MKNKLCILLLGLVTFAMAHSDNIYLKRQHPSRYVVKEGDTLWHIAGRFLKFPWQWPLILQHNPQIKHPNHLYPGDVLVLNKNASGPYLTVMQNGVVKLRPMVRSKPLDNAIPPIPLTVIKPFLNGSQVVGKNTLIRMPHIVAFVNEHIVGGNGIDIYVRGIRGKPHQLYNIFRSDMPYQDVITHKILGYSALHVGQAEMIRPGEPAKMRIASANQDVQINDHLIPSHDNHLQANFIPKAPKTTILGHITSVFAGVTEIGQHQVVVIDRGQKQGLETGDILLVRRSGYTISDPLKSLPIYLPSEQAGELMIFRTFPLVSFGLILHANSSMHIGDTVVSP